MARKTDFEVMLEQAGDDEEELRDVLAMMGAAIDKNTARVKRIEKQIEKINAMYPSTKVIKR